MGRRTRGHARRRGHMWRMLALSTIGSGVIGFLGMVACGHEALRETPMGPRIPPSTAPLQDTSVLPFLQHLQERGVGVQGYTVEDTVSLGWLICRHFDISQELSLGYEIDRITEYTRDRAVAAAFVDAATLHLC